MSIVWEWVLIIWVARRGPRLRQLDTAEPEIALPPHAQILNYSGRGVRPEAMKSPETISAAIAALDGLLGSTPESLVKRAQEQRGSSRGVSGV